jgi:hypothetical protein
MPRSKSGAGCPIRKSRDQRSLASPPGLSQRATSFIASQRQGIHQMPFACIRFLPNRRAQGQNPAPAIGGDQTPAPAGTHQTQAASHEDTFPDGPMPRPASRRLRPRPIRLGHITNSLLTLQSTPASRPARSSRTRRDPGRMITTSPKPDRPCGPRPGRGARWWRRPWQRRHGGGERDRTDDLLLAKQALSQLSYTPVAGIARQGSGIRSSDRRSLTPDP